MAEFRGVRYVESVVRPVIEQAARDRTRVTRVLDFLGDEEPLTFQRRETIRRLFLGYTETRVTAGHRWLSRLSPHWYVIPNATSSPTLYASAFTHSEPLLVADNESTDEHADGDVTGIPERWRVHVDYEQPEGYEVLDDDAAGLQATAGPLLGLPDEGDALRRGWSGTRNITRQTSKGSRIIPLRQEVFRYVNTFPPHPTAEPFPWPDSYELLTYTWDCPAAAFPDVAVQKALSGTVNNDTFDNYPANTLMLMSAPDILRKDRFGQWTKYVRYDMRFCPRYNASVDEFLGHQAVIYYTQAGGVEWRQVTTDGSPDAAKLPFKQLDYSALFRPRQD